MDEERLARKIDAYFRLLDSLPVHGRTEGDPEEVDRALAELAELRRRQGDRPTDEGR